MAGALICRSHFDTNEIVNCDMIINLREFDSLPLRPEQKADFSRIRVRISTIEQ